MIRILLCWIMLRIRCITPCILQSLEVPHSCRHHYHCLNRFHNNLNSPWLISSWAIYGRCRINSSSSSKDCNLSNWMLSIKCSLNVKFRWRILVLVLKSWLNHCHNLYLLLIRYKVAVNNRCRVIRYYSLSLLKRDHCRLCAIVAKWSHPVFGISHSLLQLSSSVMIASRCSPDRMLLHNKALRCFQIH